MCKTEKGLFVGLNGVDWLCLTKQANGTRFSITAITTNLLQLCYISHMPSHSLNQLPASGHLVSVLLTSEAYNFTHEFSQMYQISGD